MPLAEIFYLVQSTEAPSKLGATNMSTSRVASKTVADSLTRVAVHSALKRHGYRRRCEGPVCEHSIERRMA